MLFSIADAPDSSTRGRGRPRPVPPPATLPPPSPAPRGVENDTTGRAGFRAPRRAAGGAHDPGRCLGAKGEAGWRFHHPRA